MTSTTTSSAAPLKVSTTTTDNVDHSRFSWRDGEKENAKPPPKLSLGISPSNFYRKRDRKLTNSEPPPGGEQPLWKETVETNLLFQAKDEHKAQLEAKRKAFRKLTTLKTWPLQDMAMEHLDHLLSGNHKQDGGSQQQQFHGGDCLSSESSSSLSSVEAKRRTTTSPGGGKNHTSSPTKEKMQDYIQEFQSTKEALWNQEPRIFATEKAQGKRKYYVGHFGRIADWYWRKSNPKHLFEVIREQTPCRLYFDLEYQKAYNSAIIDPMALLEDFRHELAADLKKYFDVSLTQAQIIDLDSSTDTKFSRHWIVNLEDEDGVSCCLFEDAPTVGRFVKRLVARLAEELATGQLQPRRPTLAQHLFVKTRDANKTSCFIDLGVYTRNRLFRVFASSKFGKTATLQVADTNRYPLEPLPGKQPPTPKASLEECILANDWEPHARALADTLVVPLASSSEGYCPRILKVEEETHMRQNNTTTNTGTQQKTIYHPAIRNSATPLPSLDKYINEVLASRGGVPGAIRAWSIDCGPRDVPISITYQLSRNRYCELIGRSHKSNNIYWTIVFDSWTCIQGCHDPECFGRGAPSAIPRDRVLTIDQEFQAWQEEEFEKALLALNLDDVPLSTTTSAKASSDTAASSSSDYSTAITIAGEKKKDSEDGNDDGSLFKSSSLLSDEALLGAVLANPELFP